MAEKDNETKNVDGQEKAPIINKEELSKRIHSKSGRNLLVALAIVIVLFLVGGGLFFAGRASRRLASFGSRPRIERSFNLMGGFGGRRTMMGGGFGQNALKGKVTAVNDKQFTVDQNGTSVTVQVSDSTRFPISSANKVNVNDNVIVMGQKDSNGVVQATRILVNPSTFQ